MIDIQVVRDKPDFVKQKSAQKNIEVDVGRLLDLDKERKDLLQAVEELRARRNEIANSQKGAKPSQLSIDEGKQIKIKLAEKESYLSETEAEWHNLLKQIPNIALDEVPVGKTENDNIVRETVGQKPEFNFKPLNHAVLGENNGTIDKKRAAKVAGARFAYLKGDLVRLQMALMRFGVDRLGDQDFLGAVIKKNNLSVSNKPFIPVLPPAVAKTDIYESTARLDRAETTYKLADDDLWLNASAEHTLAPMFFEETLDEKELPLRFVGYTTAFRREAGSYGKDTEGIIRLHQFNKLEMESFSTQEQGREEHMFLIAVQRQLVEELGISYQLIQKCTADIGGPNASGWDINCWFPGQDTYRETHTADYMSDYQSRRMMTKYRDKRGISLFVHTNDATVFAERMLVAIIENYQKSDGSVAVPNVLKSYI